MAKFQAGVGANFDFLFEEEWQQVFEPMAQLSVSATQATYEDSLGNQVVMLGNGLGNASGTVARVTITDADGDMIWDVTDLSINYTELHEAVQADWDYGISDFMGELMRGNDVFTGTSGNEELLVDADLGNDIVKGLGGDDFFRAGPGNNKMNGGAGWDILAYHHTGWPEAQPTRGVVLDVEAGTAVNPWGGTDVIRNFETYWLSKFDDIVKNANADNGYFLLLEGDDRLDGRGGFTQLDYGREALYGATNGISLDLSKKTAIDGFGDIDTLRSIERVLGTEFDDTIAGDKRGNTIIAREGNDVLTGNGGKDVFEFYEVWGVPFGHDQITDFGTGKREGPDLIELSYIAGVKTFDDVLEIAEDTDEGVLISFDADNSITLLGVSIDDLTAGNFVIVSF